MAGRIQSRRSLDFGPIGRQSMVTAELYIEGGGDTRRLFACVSVRAGTHFSSPLDSVDCTKWWTPTDLQVLCYRCLRGQSRHHTAPPRGQRGSRCSGAIDLAADDQAFLMVQIRKTSPRRRSSTRSNEPLPIALNAAMPRARFRLSWWRRLTPPSSKPPVRTPRRFYSD